MTGYQTNDETIPDRLGPYEIEGRLAYSGKTSIYRARDKEMKRDLAIKTVQFAAPLQRDTILQFNQKAALVASFQHPHILPLYAFSVDPDQRLLYIAMKFANEGALAGLLRSQPQMSLVEVSLIVRQLSAALQYVHDQKAFHGNIKLSNILCHAGYREGARFRDFLLADFAIIGFSGYAVASDDFALVEFAPVQQEKSIRGDIQAFGMIVYELLTGRLVNMRSLVSNGQLLLPDPRIARPALTPALAAVLQKGLVLSGYPSVKELSEAFLWAAREVAFVLEDDDKLPDENMRNLVERIGGEIQTPVSLVPPVPPLNLISADMRVPGDTGTSGKVIIPSPLPVAPPVHQHTSERILPLKETVEGDRVIHERPKYISLIVLVGAILIIGGGIWLLSYIAGSQRPPVVLRPPTMTLVRFFGGNLQVTATPRLNLQVTATPRFNGQISSRFLLNTFNNGSNGAIDSTTFSPDGTKFVTLSEDYTFREWDIAASKSIKYSPDLRSKPTSALYNPDGGTIMTTEMNDRITVWSVSTQTIIFTLTGQHDAFSPDGKVIVTTSLEGSVEFWDAHNGLPLFTLGDGSGSALPPRKPHQVAFGPDGQLYLNYTDQNVNYVDIWNVTTNKLLWHLPVAQKVYPQAISTDGKRVITHDLSNGSVSFWDLTGVPLLPHQSQVPFKLNSSFIVLSDDGTQFATGSPKQTVGIFETGINKDPFSLPIPANYIGSINFSHDGKQLITTIDNKIYLWNITVAYNQTTHPPNATAPVRSTIIAPSPLSTNSPLATPTLSLLGTPGNP